jgi:hypothetical protein
MDRDTVLLVTAFAWVVVAVLFNVRKYKSENTPRYYTIISFVVLLCLWLGEGMLFSLYVDPRKAKAATSWQVKSSGEIMSFYLAPNGKAYSTEADYKKTLR